MTPPSFFPRCVLSVGTLCSFIIFCFLGCSKQPNSASMAEQSSPEYEASMVGKQTVTATFQKDATGGNGQQHEQEAEPAAVQRKLIYTAELRLRVDAVDSSHRRIVAAVERYQGYTASDNRNAFGGRVENAMTIRIAPQHFDALLAAVEREAVYTDTKSLRTQDVTQEFVDVEARLQSKRAAEEQYREILKRAGSIKDVLEVQKYLSDIREEIEAAQGRIQYLQSQVSYATINVVLYENISNADGPPEETFVGQMSSALSGGWSGFLLFLIGVLSIWPVWLIAALVGWGGWKMVKRIGKNTAASGANTTQINEHE